MKRFPIVSLIILFCLTLCSCAANRYPTMSEDKAKECWQNQVDHNANFWKNGSDRWFWTGDPNSTELANERAPYTAAISMMKVKVPDFTNLRVNGDFQVQLYGTYGHNSVYIYGPNDAVRETLISVNGNTLCLSQTKNAPRCMGRVIIRIGINQLHQLFQLGCGRIEGIHLKSNCLTITTAKSARGNIYLSGDLNVQRINAEGASAINIFGAYTPVLDVYTCGSGCVNVCGNVGIRYIKHTGCGNINIIGANSDSLKIHAEGSGKIGINGTVNVKLIRAKDNVNVFINHAVSCYIYAYLCDNAKVGISGATDKLYVDTFGSANFMGRFLCAGNAFARSRDCSHINVAANTKIFASATDNSGVYFFGEPSMLSQFVSGRGCVIPIFGSDAVNGCAGKLCLKGERPGLVNVRELNAAMRERKPVHHKTKRKYRGEG